MRPLAALFIAFLGLQVFGLHAAVTKARLRTMSTFKRQCENDGNGKACYDYGRMLWSTPGVIDRKLARKYLIMGCQRGYKPSCASYNTHNATIVRHRKRHKTLSAEENSGKCFSSEDLGTARLIPNVIRKQYVRGQKIDMIKTNSFWKRVGLQDGDIIVRVNNHTFNSTKEALEAFGHSGKNFGFQVERAGLPITLWYTCN